MTNVLEITTLGGLLIRQGGRPVTDLGSRKAEALLVFLACSRRPQPREVLADLLWDERSTSQALMDLRWPLSRLNTRLGAHLIVTRTTVAFNLAAPYWLDVEELETALAGARAGHPRGDLLAPSAARDLEPATARYTGPFLRGFAVRGSSGFEDWMLREQDRLERSVLAALHDLVTGYVEHGDAVLGVPAATRVLQLDPLHEATHRQLMHLLLLSGQRRAALEQYAACRHLLATELGSAPDPATTALYERIRAGAPALPAAGAPGRPAEAPRARPAQLPQPLTPFVGRAEELTALATLLADPGCPLITLVGPGGTGKTRLAIAAASGAAGFADGVVFVPLAQVSKPAFLLAALAEALGVAGGDGPALLARVQGHLAGRQMLLVLDNFEQLQAGAALLPALLAGLPGLKLLVTSREPLNLAAEQVFDVAGLTVPPSEAPAPDSAEQYAAVQLFVQRARRVRFHFSYSAEVAPWITRICRLVEGLPLAIELAAMASRERTCREIAEGLERNLDLPATTPADVPARHGSLRAVFDQSWDLLSAAEQQALRRVSVFRGGFTAAGAAQVAAAAREVLVALTRRSLLRQSPAGRFDLHELLRQYAEERLLADPQEQGRIVVQHAAYYVALAEAAHPELVGPHQVEWLVTIEQEHANMRAALSWALNPAGAPVAGDTALRLATGLNRFWYFRGYLTEGRRWLEAALQADPAPRVSAAGTPALPEATRLRGVAQNALGMLAREQGDYVAAAAALEESLTLLRTLDDRNLLAAPLNNLGLTARDLGDYARAERLIGEALALYRAQDDGRSTALLLNNLGKLAHRRGDLAGARRRFQESLALHAALTDPRGKALVLANLAQVARDERDYAQAAALFRASLPLYLEVGDQRGITDCLEGLIVAGAAAVLPASPAAERLAVLCGAAQALRERTGAQLAPADQAALQQAFAWVRAALDGAAWLAAVADGRALAADHAVAFALAPPAPVGSAARLPA